jgi:hypothetical protein
VEQLDLSEVKRVDFEIIGYLKDSHPDLYRTLRRAVKSRHRHGSETGVNLATDMGGPGDSHDTDDDITTQQPDEQQRA